MKSCFLFSLSLLGSEQQSKTMVSKNTVGLHRKESNPILDARAWKGKCEGKELWGERERERER